MTATLLRIPMDEYHQRPGLSSSTAATLISRSPLHAWSQHPALGGLGKSPTFAMDRGQVSHALTLGTGKDFEILQYDDYRTKKAQTDRDAARAAGKVPILREDYENAATMSETVRVQLADRGIYFDGESELGFEWNEESRDGAVLCRGMMDHVNLDTGTIIDLKFVTNASQQAIERSAENFGYAIQAAAYTRALVAYEPALAGRIDFLFAFCEAEPPFAMNVVRPDGPFRELGERRWLRAVNQWGHCLATNKWPAYGSDVNFINPPGWALAQEGFEL